MALIDTLIFIYFCLIEVVDGLWSSTRSYFLLQI